MADHLTLPEMLTEPICQSEKFRNGDFEIISSDNVRLCVPMYLFQFASSVFRDMIETGSGEKRIELPEEHWYIEPALDVIRRGVFDVGENGPVPYDEVVVPVIEFFKKYDCQSALSQVEQFINTPCEGFHQVFCRLLAAMHLERDDLCGDLIERYPNDFGFLNIAKNERLSYRTFSLIPSRYYWALTRADPEHLENKKVYCHYFSPRERFDHLLRELGNDGDAWFKD